MAWGDIDLKMRAILSRLVSQTLQDIRTGITERLSINIIDTLKYHGMGRILFNIDQFMMQDPTVITQHIFKVCRWPSSADLMGDRVIRAGNLRDTSNEMTWDGLPRPLLRFSAAAQPVLGTAAVQSVSGTAAASGDSHDSRDEDRARGRCSVM